MISVHDKNRIPLYSKFIQGGPKMDLFRSFFTHVYDDAGKRSIGQNVQLFIKSKKGILNVAIFNYFFISSELSLIHI